MSRAYTVVQGDTFDLISRKEFGTEVHAGLIERANPGLSDVLTPGITILIPDIAQAPRIAPQRAPAATESEVAIAIDSTRFRFWTGVRLMRSIDSIDSVEFVAPFQEDSEDFKNTFRPFSYKDIEITVGGAPLFSGTAVSIEPSLGIPRIVSVSGYAKPGVLNDSPAPASMAQNLEFSNVDLLGIAKALCEPFGIAVVSKADVGPSFEQVAIGSTEKIFGFLTKLARQRNLVITNDPSGALVFTRGLSSGVPVARLDQADSDVLEVSPVFNPQEYYSDITGVEPEFFGLAGAQFTVKNPHLGNVVRPLSFSAQDAEGGDVKSSVEAKIARMFGNMASYAVTLPTWFDPAGVIWTPNTIISLKAPGAMIYAEYDFIVRSVELVAGPSAMTARLNLAIPGSFSGKIPEGLPWDL